MAYLDENGVVHGADNSFFTLLGRAMSEPAGILRIFTPNNTCHNILLDKK